MTGHNSLHNFYDVSYQCWFASEEAKIYRNNFNSSNAVVCSHLILTYTVRLAIINAVELERNGWFFLLPLLRNVMLWLKRTSTKFANRISYQIWYKGCLKESLVGGSKSAKGGPYPLADLDRGGGPNPLADMDQGIQIRCDTGARQNKINFIFWIWKLATPQVTWNVFLTITQGNDLVFSITKPTCSTSEPFN